MQKGKVSVCSYRSCYSASPGVDPGNTETTTICTQL